MKIFCSLFGGNTVGVAQKTQLYTVGKNKLLNPIQQQSLITSSAGPRGRALETPTPQNRDFPDSHQIIYDVMVTPN